MATEIERKYLIQLEAWQQAKKQVKYTHISQGYLSLEAARTVRIRMTKEMAFLTIKGITKGISRVEFEYQIPFNEGLELLKICQGSIIKKKRYTLSYDNLIWEIDEFEGDNLGLVVAEVELESEDQIFALPTWIKEEVSDDNRYYNANLVQYPFKDWV